MNIPVVRVKSYLGKDVIEYGTGVMISQGMVVTASHVLAGDHHVIIIAGEEKSIIEEKESCGVTLLRIENDIEAVEYSSVLFTDEEYLNDQTKWMVEGFITEEQNHHEMAGTGLLHIQNHEEQVDIQLKNIEKGYSENYQGMSGSPVVCNGRIVGILQIQDFIERGLLGVFMISAQNFREILPDTRCECPVYIEQLFRKTTEFTEKAIEKNIKSRKYIPDIFVEEGEYKENFRYCTEPELFLRKVVDDIQNLYLDPVNRFLKQHDVNAQVLDFKDIPQYVAEHTFLESWDLLAHRLDAAILMISKTRSQRDKEKIGLEKSYLEEDRAYYGVLYPLEQIRSELDFLKYNIILITNDAGQGKTNFLCDFTYNFLLKKGFLVLYYNAYDFREPFMNRIEKELTLDKKFSWEYVKQILAMQWREKHKKVIIVIDGLNENTALNDFGGYLSDFLKEAKKLSFLKIIMSTRNELLEERFPVLDKKNLGKEFCRLDMRQSSDTFRGRIFQGYLNYFDIEIMEGSLWESSYHALTEDILLLRFFCEVNRGKKQVRLEHIYKYNLFEKYYTIKKEEVAQNYSPGRQGIFDKLIMHICQIMLQKESFSTVPRNELTQEELTLLDKLLESDVIFKQERELKRGFLKEMELCLGFTFDEFRDFCLTRYILQNSDEFCKIWKQMHEKKWSIVEGIERYSFFCARHIEELLDVLQKQQEYDQMYWENVWELEETDITEEDIMKWKEQILTDGEHIGAVVSFLLRHDDTGYFKVMNVQRLFDIFNQLAGDLSLFQKITRKLFDKEEKNRYGIILSQERVLSCDKIISFFKENKENCNVIQDYKALLQLSIYLIEIEKYGICEMWAEVYPMVPELAEVILEQYVTKDDLPQILYHNVNYILEVVLDKNGECGRLKELKEMLHEKIGKYDYEDLNHRFSLIWEM